MSVQHNESIPTTADVRGDADERCWCTTTAVTSPSGEVLVLCVAGEVDLSTLGLLEGALAAALLRRPTQLVVDLTGVRFCSCRGFRLLLDCAVAAARHGTGYALSGASQHADRIWGMLRPDGLLPARYRSSGDALVAAVAAGLPL
ncbi:STAS domain-containing protein [Pseudonocardia saturnea]